MDDIEEKMEFEPILNLLIRNLDNCPEVTLAALFGSRSHCRHSPDSDYDIGLVIRDADIEALHGIHFNVQKDPTFDFVFIQEDMLHNLSQSSYLTFSILRKAQVLWHSCDVCLEVCNSLKAQSNEGIKCYHEEVENFVWHLLNIVQKLKNNSESEYFALNYSKFLYFIPNIYCRLREQPLVNEREAMRYLKEDSIELYDEYIGLLKLNPFSDTIPKILLKISSFMNNLLSMINWKVSDLYCEVRDLITPIDYCKFSSQQLKTAQKNGNFIVKHLLNGISNINVNLKDG